MTPGRRPGTWYRDMRLAAVVVIVVAIWANVWAHYEHSNTDALRAAEDDAMNLTGIAQTLTARTVEALDQALLATADLYRRDPAAFQMPDWVRDTSFLNGLNIQLAVADAAGLVVASTLPLPGTSVSIADRQHFRVHRDGGHDGLFVSAPLVGRVSNRASVQFVRAIRDEGGAFLGVVVASLDPAPIGRMFQAMEIGRGQVILAGPDGVIRAAWPPEAAALPPRTLVPVLERSRDTASGSFVDDTERPPWVVGYRRIPGYPLLVVMRINPLDTRALAWAELRHDLLIGASLSALVIGLHIAQQRHRRRIETYQQALTVTLANISHGIIMVGPDGRVAVMNRRSTELLALPDTLSHPGVCFQDIMDWQATHAACSATDDTLVATMARHGDLDASIPVYERTRADGTVVEVRTTLLPDGSAVRTYSDLTDRKHFEQELAAARDAAEAGARARSEFLRIMSHEIRTPLNGILGGVALMRDLALPAEADHYAGIVQHAGRHLLTLVDDILDLTSLDTGKVTLHQDPFSPAALLEGVAAMMGAQAGERGLGLSLHIDPTLPDHAVGDADRLRQVVVNLVDNAVKFTETGSIRITARAADEGEAGIRLHVAVTDTGIGIPPDRRRDLFQVFTQLDGSFSRRADGTGIGLAICHQLVLLMQGQIGVDSQPGRGSTFRFHVLLGRASAVAPDTDPEEPLRVLVAEDNPTNRLVATRMLARMGHHVDAVEDGAAAVETLRQAPYDVVLMDLMMPGMDGLAATRAIRAAPPPLDRTPIIGLTANVHADDEAACRAAGMDGFLAKPVSADRLSATLRAVLATADAAGSSLSHVREDG